LFDPFFPPGFVPPFLSAVSWLLWLVLPSKVLFLLGCSSFPQLFCSPLPVGKLFGACLSLNWKGYLLKMAVFCWYFLKAEWNAGCPGCLLGVRTSFKNCSPPFSFLQRSLPPPLPTAGIGGPALSLCKVPGSFQWVGFSQGKNPLPGHHPPLALRRDLSLYFGPDPLIGPWDICLSVVSLFLLSTFLPELWASLQAPPFVDLADLSLLIVGLLVEALLPSGGFLFGFSELAQGTPFARVASVHKILS